MAKSVKTAKTKKVKKAKKSKAREIESADKAPAQYKHKIIDAHAVHVPLGVAVRDSMRKYSDEVIEDRAVPDFRDGLKPVQRRVLYGMMNDIGLSHTGATRKCAAVVGAVMGSYHPHGDSSIYDALTKLYHKRYRLVMPRGNFGNEISSASAMRYTEVKFTKTHQAIFADKDVMERVPNFDGHTTEPLVINSRLPLFLMNGCSGIAVGFSVNVPSHNLKELVDALIYTVKHYKTVGVKELLNFVQGPDCRNGGKLISKKQDLLDLYTNGRGSLEYQCEYELSKDDEGRTIISVIGYPDESVFNVETFLKWCSDNQASGLIYSVEDDYIDSRYGEKAIDNKPIKTVIVRVTVSNKRGFDAVMKKITVRGHYEFYSTKREEEGISLKTYNFLDLLKQWIRWRKVEEKKVLDLEIQRTKKSLWSEETRLIAMQPKHIDIIADGLKQSKVDFEDYIVKHLKITMEQAKFIADLKIGNLRKASIPEQEKKIADLKKKIAKLNDDLLHISRVVIKHLEELSPYFDSRRTKVGGRVVDSAKISVAHTGDPITMLASRDGKLFTNVTEKGSTTADVFSTTSHEGAVIFEESGLTQVISTTECDGKAGPAYKNIVGIAPHETTNLIVIGKNGFAIKMPGATEHKQSEFQSIKGTTLVAGFGLNPDSQLLVWGKKHGEFACLRGDKIKEVRKNTGGVKIVGFKPVRALVVHSGQYLYTDDGSRVQPAKAGDIVDKIKLFVINDRNIVIYKTGRRKFMDRAATIKEISRDSAQVRFVYPASLPKTGPITESSDTADTAPTSKKAKKAEKPTKSVRTGKVVSKTAKKKAK
jgi:DNA gyrase/topoisomerase IV subunit A